MHTQVLVTGANRSDNRFYDKAAACSKVFDVWVEPSDQMSTAIQYRTRRTQSVRLRVMYQYAAAIGCQVYKPSCVS